MPQFSDLKFLNTAVFTQHNKKPGAYLFHTTDASAVSALALPNKLSSKPVRRMSRANAKF